jgi:hypothetical protein
VSVPIPTPIYRFLHVNNLRLCLARGGLHAPNHAPNDGRSYKTIHNLDIQQRRRVRTLPCGPGGVVHDYLAFYFGPRSPMLLQLHTGRVQGFDAGQEPLIYVVSTAQAVEQSGAGFVISDGHGIAAFTRWYHDLVDLNKLDWDAVASRYWADTVDDMDRQRRKQAEFLVHRVCDWGLIQEIGVLNRGMKARVEGILTGFDAAIHRPVNVHRDWYY